MIKILNTKGSLLNKKDLEEHLKKFSADNVVIKMSERNTYPVPRVKDNCKYISLVYTLLNEHVKIGIPIHPAGEWILDNYYMIEKSAKTIEKELNVRKYCGLPGLMNQGFARVYKLFRSISNSKKFKYGRNLVNTNFFTNINYRKN